MIRKNSGKMIHNITWVFKLIHSVFRSRHSALCENDCAFSKKTQIIFIAYLITHFRKLIFLTSGQ